MAIATPERPASQHMPSAYCRVFETRRQNDRHDAMQPAIAGPSKCRHYNVHILIFIEALLQQMCSNE